MFQIHMFVQHETKKLFHVQGTPGVGVGGVQVVVPASRWARVRVRRGSDGENRAAIRAPKRRSGFRAPPLLQV